MSAFAPRFCAKHLKIHKCDEISVTKVLTNAETDLGARVRRLHGTLTEEELAEEARKAKPAPGSIGAMLAAAKGKIKEQKKNFEEQSGANGKEISANEANDRMAALRARVSSDESPSTDNDSPVYSYPPQEQSGLAGTIQKARKHQFENQEPEYVAPERSTTGEKESKKSIKKDTFFDDDDDIKPVNTASKTPKSSPKRPSETNKLYSVEETQELIQSAVKEALKQVGIIDETGKAKKPAVKKETTAKKAPAKKTTSAAAKKPAAKKTTTKVDPSKKPNL